MHRKHLEKPRAIGEDKKLLLSQAKVTPTRKLQIITNFAKTIKTTTMSRPILCKAVGTAGLILGSALGLKACPVILLWKGAEKQGPAGQTADLAEKFAYSARTIRRFGKHFETK